ncbi:hypothetical protein SK128_010846, partial [Halocaridina rubra]
VQPQFPSTSSYKLLESLSLSLGKVGCASTCIRNPRCLTFCITSTTCVLYEIPVRSAYSGPGYFGQSVSYTYTKCYSLTASPEEFLSTATPQSSSIFPSSLPNSQYFPLNGYSDGYDIMAMFNSGYEFNPWWSAELPIAKEIFYVFIHGQYLKNIEIRFGMDSNYALNPLIYSNDLTNNDDIIHVSQFPPVTGKLLSIQKLNAADGYLQLGVVAAF